MAARNYHIVNKYIANAICIAPIHVGSISGENGEVLIHPALGVPFIQASSIAGVLKSISNKVNGTGVTEKLFGSTYFSENSNASESASAVRISDGNFDVSSVSIELRPRIKINSETGTVSSEKKNEKDMGQKFEMESIGKGAKFSFSIYLYDEELKEALEKIFGEIIAQHVQLGGQKSNGQGYIALSSLLYKSFDLTSVHERRKWAEEENLPDSEYENITDQLIEAKEGIVAYTITAKGKAEGSMLVKGLIPISDENEDKTPDATNIQNSAGEYIIPGSSLKGVFRNHIEQIAKQINKDFLVNCIFGNADTEEEKAKSGCISIWDTIVGKEKDNDNNVTQYHVHIDKFTGGVFNQGLFSSRDVNGNVEFKITIANGEYADAACGLVILAFRDLNLGMMNIGSGYNIGKGFIQLGCMDVMDNKQKIKATIDLENEKIEDNTGIVLKAFSALNDASKKEDR